MSHRKRITEDDLRLTRNRITVSYGALKHSALSLPSQVLRSTEQTICRYPAGSILMLGIAGGILYGLFRLTPVWTRSEMIHDRINTASSSDGLFRDLLVRTIPFLTPYLLAFIRSGLYRIQAVEQEDDRMKRE